MACCPQLLLYNTLPRSVISFVVIKVNESEERERERIKVVLGASGRSWGASHPRDEAQPLPHQHSWVSGQVHDKSSLRVWVSSSWKPLL